MQLYLFTFISFVFFTSCQPRKTKEVYKTVECPDRIVLNLTGFGGHFYKKKGLIELVDKDEIKRFWDLGKSMDGPINKNLQLADFVVYIFYCNGDDIFFEYKLIYVDGKYVYPKNQFKSFINSGLTTYIDSLLHFSKIENFEGAIHQSIYENKINPEAFTDGIKIDTSKFRPF